MPVRVPDRPPVASILTPSEGQVLVAGQSMRLWAMVTDATGKALEVERAVWKVDGKEAGAGLDVFVAAPAEGKHKATLTVKAGTKRAETAVGFLTMETPKV